MKDKILGMLASRGVKLPPDASDEMVLGALYGGRYGKEIPTQTVPAPVSQGSGFVEPLLGCDPKQVTPARAGAVFAQYARGLCDTEYCDLSAAWEKAKLLKPELYARMLDAKEENSTLQNNDVPRLAPVPFTSKAFVAAAFHLPTNVDNGVFEAAFRANGSQNVTADSEKIFMGIVTFYMQSRRAKDVRDARRQVIDDFPDLARAAGQNIA